MDTLLVSIFFVLENKVENGSSGTFLIMMVFFWGVMTFLDEHGMN